MITNSRKRRGFTLIEVGATEDIESTGVRMHDVVGRMVAESGKRS